MEIKFSSNAHRDFYEDMLGKCQKQDSYHRAFFYLMGLTGDTRTHINDVFDFQEDGIIPEGLTAGWQTGGSIRVCRMAFNLWNGYSEAPGDEFTPAALFCCEFARYFVEAIKLRYPEYMEPSRLS